MSRAFLIVLAVLVGLLVIGVVALGAFPPKIHQAPVEHVIPNERVGGSG